MLDAFVTAMIYLVIFSGIFILAGVICELDERYFHLMDKYEDYVETKDIFED